MVQVHQAMTANNPHPYLSDIFHCTHFLGWFLIKLKEAWMPFNLEETEPWKKVKFIAGSVSSS
jgi:hypothetical protein